MSSYVYVVHDPTRPGIVKIGKANDPFSRVKDLSRGASSPIPWEIKILLECISENEAYNCERVIHTHFANKGFNKEWFSVTFEEIKEYCLLTWPDQRLISDPDDLFDFKFSFISTPNSCPIDIVSFPSDEEIELNYKAIEDSSVSRLQPKIGRNEWLLFQEILRLWKSYGEQEITKEQLVHLFALDKMAKNMNLSYRSCVRAKKELLKNGLIKEYDPTYNKKMYCVTSKVLSGKEEEVKNSQEEIKPNFKKEYLPKNYEERLRSLINSYVYKAVDSQLLAGLSPTDNILLLLLVRSQAYEMSLRKIRKSFNGLSINAIEQLSNMTKPTIRASLKRLSNKGLINQYVLEENRTGFYVIAERLLDI
jgi:DNA-binding MarR family transcriptional regulator/predicted transcriptional regulator